MAPDSTPFQPYIKNLVKRLRQVILGPSTKKYESTNFDSSKANLRLEKLELMMGLLLTDKVRSVNPQAGLKDVEFSVYSQFGEDGILQWLLSRIKIENPSFVEFGVENYEESNTRFLLKQNNWKGLVIDSSESNVAYIRNDPDLVWRYDLTSVCSHVTADNINFLLQANGFEGDIGLLSIDVDGNDYWIWKAITVVKPRIVICEYNAVFGSKRALTIPYNESFSRREAHYSDLLFGASFKALCNLADEKGYVFVGCASAGNDAFFVRNDIAADIQPMTYNPAYVESKFRQSKDANGNYSQVSGIQILELIKECEVFCLETQSLKKVADLLPLS
jgi:hypothetical protein